MLLQDSDRSQWRQLSRYNKWVAESRPRWLQRRRSSGWRVWNRCSLSSCCFSYSLVTI